MATIGLGANLPSAAGSPDQTIESAIRALEIAGRVLARSSLYRSEPLDYEDQPTFINAVARLETAMDAQKTLDFLLATERRYGRDREHSAPKGPRTLDLDLLLFDEQIVDSPGLTLPHPALAQRRFVLVPLCEIAPDLHHPVLGATMAELLAVLPSAGSNRIEAVRPLEIARDHS